VAQNQEVVAVWDDPVLELRKPDPDWQWFDDEIGVWLHNLFGHNQVYVLNSADTPIYAMADGARLAIAGLRPWHRSGRRRWL
jgi:sensor domain CHASE-containing protein